MEKVMFDVPNFDLPFNAILGWPSLAKFMASTHYAYMVVKMPSPKGPITVPIDMEGVVRCVELVHITAVTDQPPHALGPQEHAPWMLTLPRPSRWPGPSTPNRNSRSS